MFLPGPSLATCLLCLSFWSKLHSKPTTAIFNSGSSTSITLKDWDDVISLVIVAFTSCLLMQRRIDVVETPRHRKVRRPYAVRTQYILHDTPITKIIRHSIASDMLWIRNVRHTCRYAVSMLRDFRSYGERVTYAWRIEVATNMWRYFKHVTPFRTLANEEIVQRISYGSFRWCDVPCDSGYAVRSQADS